VVRTVRAVWQGHLTLTSAPRLDGHPTAGATPTIVPATWTGGWAARSPYLTDSDQWDVIACRTPAREDCWYLGPAGLTQRWAGWYLLVVDRRYAPSPSGPALATVPSNPTPARPSTGATVAYSTPVPVCCTLPAPAEDPVPPPTVKLRARALRSHGRLLVGRVDCTLRCTVALRAGAYTRTFTVEGPASLSIPIRHGRQAVRVRVDGKLVAQRRTKLI
jgi:hypothetical protein